MYKIACIKKEQTKTKQKTNIYEAQSVEHKHNAFGGHAAG